MNMQAALAEAISAANADADVEIERVLTGPDVPNAPTPPRPYNEVDVLLAAPANDDTSPPQPSYPQAGDDDDVKFTNISDRALLFTLKRSMFSTNVKDIRKTNEYGAGHVTKKLFKGHNLVSDARSAYDKVYNFVIDNTLPWDVGVRLANAYGFADDFSAKLRVLIADADTAVAKLAANWPAVRDADHQRLTLVGIAHNNPDLALWDDYPDDIASCYGITTDIDPIAKAEFDPRWGVTDDQIEAYKQRLVDANKESGKNVVANLLKPQHEALAKLTDYDEEERMSKTIVTNMTDVADRMSRANVCDDPAVAQHITDLSTLAGGLDKDILKHSKVARDVAVSDITALVKKMEGFV